MKIGILGPFGFGNLGDAAIQQAMLQNLQKRFPQAEVIGFSLNPEDTERRHDIKTYPIGRMANYGWVGRGTDDYAYKGAHQLADRFRHASNRAVRMLGKALFSLPLEALSILQASRWLDGLDAFIISGGGQLDDYWGGVWYHPYTLFLWSRLARLRRIPFLIVSVGAGPLNSAVSRWFTRRTLSRSQYRSYRDAESRDYIRRIGFANDDPVYPDLAQSLLVAEAADRPADEGSRGVVGIGPMSYFDPRVWPEKDSQVYRQYVGKLAAFSCWLLENGFSIRLFPGEAVHDVPVIEDLLALLEKTRPETSAGRIDYHPVEQVDELMAQLAGTDVVVASRFHGVLLSQLVGKPVLALSYHPKIDALMADTGEGDYCLQIHDFDLDVLIRRFQDLWANRDAIQARLARRVDTYRAQLDEQYERISEVITDEH